MNPELVRALESGIAAQLSEVFERVGEPLPSSRVLHLMAKAATTVYEGCLEVQRPPKPRENG